MEERESAPWFLVCGEHDKIASAAVEQSVEDALKAGHYTRDEVAYVSKVQLSAVPARLSISDERLEKLRRLCQTWEADLTWQPITSHRRVIGPLIVAGKRAIFPVLRVLLKDYIRRQREFNAAAIALMAELSAERQYNGPR